MGRYQLSTTFPIDEVRIVLLVTRMLQRGGDVSDLMRSPHWANVVRKFQRMEQKWSKGPPVADVALRTAPQELEPAPGPPAPASGSDHQHFRDQGYSESEIANILRILKEDKGHDK